MHQRADLKSVFCLRLSMFVASHGPLWLYKGGDGRSPRPVSNVRAKRKESTVRPWRSSAMNTRGKQFRCAVAPERCQQLGI